MADQMQRQGPLTHIRILDLGRIMAAPWATQIFADLGADVIKIERPGAGDDTRAWGPPFLSDAEGRATKEAGYFLSVNRGKRSVALDIATAEGQAIVRKLAESADVESYGKIEANEEVAVKLAPSTLPPKTASLPTESWR